MVERPVAKRKLAPKVANGFYRVPVLSNFGGAETIEWVRIAEPAETPAAAATGWVTAEPTQTPFFSTTWQPRKGWSEEPNHSRLMWIAQLIQDRIQAEQEDRQLQGMLLQQQRHKRLRTGLDTWKRDTGQSHALRFEAPRIETAQRQPLATMYRHMLSVSSNNPAGGILDTRRSDVAGVVGSRSAAGQPTSIEDAVAVTSASVEASVPPRTRALQTGQLPLEKIRLLRVLPSERHADHDTIGSGETLKYSLEGFTNADCPASIALSYVWGSERFTSTIFINGASTPVRTNLAEALSSIEKSDPDALSVGGHDLHKPAR
ncbi:hypothetical protein F5Y09DRAFT_344417 [Xylaria sp. FL1042]|nr:hypothetical protein F5Y09DRAFT_344417 [Xylaria sp. FL1042]